MKAKPIALLAFLIFVGNLVNAQSNSIWGSVVYQCLWTTAYPIQAKGMLCFTDTVASFMAISEFTAEEINLEGKKVVNMNDNRVVVEDETSPGNLRVIMRRDPNTMRESKGVPFNVFTSNRKHKMYQLVNDTYYANKKNLHEPYVYLEEELGRMAWRIEPETKQIGQFLCQKATCSFRGRDYIAWFTPEIPVSYGPWKLNGLPGLILEVNDLKNEVIFTATEVNVGGDSSCRPLEPQGYPVYALQDYVIVRKQINEEKDKKIESKFAVVQARLPEGISAETKSHSKPIGLELDYEF